MKCNQSRSGFELVFLCPFPTTINITPRAPPCYIVYININIWTLLENWKDCGTWRSKVILVVVCALGTVSKSLEKGFEELEICWRIETIQTTALLWEARILRTCYLVYFAVPAVCWEEIKDSVNTEIYLNYSRELKKLRNICCILICRIIATQ